MLPVASFLVKAFLLTTYTVNRLTIDNNVVQLSHGGRVRGTILRSEKGKPFYSFKGIPYAEPPVGDLRFRAPVAKKAWTGEFDATKAGPMCPQVDILLRKGHFFGQEDCLMINVYTPQLPEEGKPNPKRYVLVYIHGGAFMIGTGTEFMAPANRIIDTGNVFVAMNYRLDSIGFLSTGDEASPGNYGLLDQSLALRWVKDNIEAFGGNPESVTIFGHSAGGASVGYQLLSPLSKGLFHRAAPISGSSLCPWAFVSNPLKWAAYLAGRIGCPEAPTSALVECLRTKPVQDVVKGINYFDDFMAFPMPFVPTLDGHFITEVPETILDSGKDLNRVPVLTGVTEAEGAGFIGCVPHGADMFMYFNVDWIIKLRFNARERQMAKWILQMLSNFAKTGNPDPEHRLQPAWPKSSSQKIEIFKINDEFTVQEHHPDVDPDQLFWKDIRKQMSDKDKGN